MKTAYSNTLYDIASLVGGTLSPGADEKTEVSSLTTDSRVADRGSLFVPIVGERFDAHTFVKPLCVGNSIAAYLTEKEFVSDTIPGIKCENTLYALGELAADYRSAFDIPVVGITGTNGKTTTKELLSHVLLAKFNVHKNEKNYNNEIGVPFALFELSNEHECAVIEMGMNHPGEISRLSRMVQPGIALITNVDAGHLEFLGSIEGVARAKSEIFESMRDGQTAFINRDTLCFDMVSDAALQKGLTVISYGLDERADITTESYTLSEKSVSVTVKGTEYSVPAYGVHNVVNLLAVVSVALHLGVSKELVQNALGSFENTGMRSQILNGKCTVINDAYNSNPLSLKSALVSASLVFPERRKIAVLGDMKELGAVSNEMHIKAAEQVKENGFSKLYLYGNEVEATCKRALELGFDSSSVELFNSKELLIKKLDSVVCENDVVLVKGSRSMKMEEVAGALAC